MENGFEFLCAACQMSITDATKKIIQASLAAFDEANVYDDIISYVIQKHALELSFSKRFYLFPKNQFLIRMYDTML